MGVPSRGLTHGTMILIPRNSLIDLGPFVSPPNLLHKLKDWRQSGGSDKASMYDESYI